MSLKRATRNLLLAFVLISIGFGLGQATIRLDRVLELVTSREDFQIYVRSAIHQAFGDGNA